MSLLIRYVKYHRYPLLTPEILLCAAALILAGAGLCLLARLRRDTLYPLIIGILILKFADVHFQLFIRAAIWISRLLSPIAVKPLLIAAFFVFMFLIFALRREVGRVAAVVWGVILLTTLILPSGKIVAGETINRPAQTRQDLPLILHLVLDEQIGVEGVPRDLPGGERLRDDLAAAFLQKDFEVYGRSFSQYSESQYALASLVNAEVFSASPDYVRSTASGYTVTRNDWLRSLREDGYSIRIYESGWIDFCQAEGVSADFCFVYPTNSILGLTEYDLGAWTKAGLVLPRTLTGSLLVPVWREPQLSTLSCLPVLERLAHDIRAHPRGVAFFVHLLLPHYSYAFDADCRLRPDPATWANVGDISATGQAEFNSESQRAASYQLYFQQVHCVLRKLTELFDQMRHDGLLETSTVLVHGDHGSRISSKAFRLLDPAVLSERDMVDHYSTFMAIRMPGVPRRYESRKESIQKIFARRILKRPLTGDSDSVFMRPLTYFGGDRTLLGRTMVDFGESDNPEAPAAGDPQRPNNPGNSHGGSTDDQ